MAKKGEKIINKITPKEFLIFKKKLSFLISKYENPSKLTHFLMGVVDLIRRRENDEYRKKSNLMVKRNQIKRWETSLKTAKRKSQPWTQKDYDFLKNNFRKFSVLEVSQILERTTYAIETKIKLLKLSSKIHHKLF